jgi:hypothetical protein
VGGFGPCPGDLGGDPLPPLNGRIVLILHRSQVRFKSRPERGDLLPDDKLRIVDELLA